MIAEKGLTNPHLKNYYFTKYYFVFRHPGSYENYNVNLYSKYVVKFSLYTIRRHVGWEGVFGATVPLVVNFGPSCREVVTVTPQQASDTDS